MPSKIKEYFLSSRLLVFCGTGGVGKTTLSAATAIAASELGLKVGIVTIDPSLRLASALGLDLDVDESSVGLPEAKNVDFYRVNAAKEFQRFLYEIEPNGRLLNNFKENQLYQKMVGRLSETQNFGAYFLLNRLLSEGEYDLVVLDTPPAVHILDFFQTSSRLKTLFSYVPQKNKSSIVGRLFSKGRASLFSIVGILTGKQFSKELESFVKFFPEISSALTKASEDIAKEFRKETTRIEMVTSLNPAKVSEISQLGEALMASDLHINHLMVNRAWPYWLDKGSANISQLAGQGGQSEEIVTYYQDSLKYVEELCKNSLPGVGKLYIPEIETGNKGLEDLVKTSEILQECFNSI